MRAIIRRLISETGQSAVLVALSLVMLCGFAALAVDIGTVAVDKGQLQNAADAAALAGAHELPSASSAVSTAVSYAQMNGMEASEVTATSPYNGNSKQVEVVCTKTVEYTFARIFGLTSTTVSARAVAEKSGVSGGAFGYAIFSGSSSSLLGLYTSSLNVTGDIHGNNSIQMNGSSQTVNGNVEAASSYTAAGSSITITGTVQGSSITTHGSTISIANTLAVAASVIDMPDFSAIAEAEATANGTAYTGNQLFNGTNINVDNSIYVDGTITVAGSSFTGTGIMLASGNIQFNGSCIETSSSSSVCVYSENGNIQINGSSIQVDGVLYAPNGYIQINGANIVINGRVIANQVQINGSNIQIVSGSGDLNCLPGGTVTLVE